MQHNGSLVGPVMCKYQLNFQFNIYIYKYTKSFGLAHRSYWLY